MDPEDPDDDEITPETEGEGGAAGKPPRPTAVGTGGSGFDDSGIGKLRRYDLDDNLNPDEFISWAVPNLTFAGLESMNRSLPSESGEENDSSDECYSRRQYPDMEDAISGLHTKNANIAFLMMGERNDVHHYYGASVPSAEAVDSSNASFDNVVSVVHQVNERANFHNEPVPAEELREMMSQQCRYGGVITGIPAMGSYTAASQNERIFKELQGHEYGLLILAVPIPKQHVTSEEFSIIDQIQRARDNDNPERKRRIKYYLELEEAYLKHVQLGTAIGMWLVGAYYFSNDLATFSRLQSLLMAAYQDDNTRPTPLRTSWELKGLQPHIEQFGLLQNRISEETTFQSLLAWRFLTPLNSRHLSAYVHLPLRK